MAIEIPDRDDRIDFPGILDDYKEELATAAAIGTAGVYVTGDNRSRIAQYPYNFLKGLNIFKGNVTHKAVADVFGYKYVSPQDALTNSF